MKKNLLLRIRPLWVWLVMVLGMGLHPAGATGEMVIPLLKTASGEFRNVKIFSRSSTHLSFAHENGTAVIKVSEVDFDSMETLEQTNAGEESPAASVPGAMIMLKPPPPPKSEPIWLAQAKATLGRLRAESDSLQLTRQQVWIALGAFALAWWFYGYCVNLICKKTGNPGGLAAWLPILQIIPLFRAAGMSGWWFVGMFIPVLNLVGQLLWCVKITQARGKGFFTAAMLIIPGTNILAFLYLAFSNGHAAAEDTYVPIRPPHALAVN